MAEKKLCLGNGGPSPEVSPRVGPENHRENPQANGCYKWKVFPFFDGRKYPWLFHWGYNFPERSGQKWALLQLVVGVMGPYNWW